MKLKTTIITLLVCTIAAFVFICRPGFSTVYADYEGKVVAESDSDETECEPTSEPTAKPVVKAKATAKPKTGNNSKSSKSGKKKSTKKAKATSTPEPTYKPIKGEKVSYVNSSAIAKKASVTKQINSTRKSIKTKLTKIKKTQKYISAMQTVIKKTQKKGSALFIESEDKSNILGKLSKYDKYIEPYKSYTLVTSAEGLFEAYKTSGLVPGLIGLSNSAAISTTTTVVATSASIQSSNIATDSSIAADKIISDNNSIQVLQSMNTSAVDIGNYLTYNYKLQKQNVKTWKAERKAAKAKLKSLKKQKASIVTADVVFNSSDITEISNITKKQMESILEGTALEQYAGIYVQIEKKYGINAIAMCSLSALESNWGTSRRAVKDHNFTGYGVYTDKSVGINADSAKENLMMTASHLAEKYLQEGGAYYHGTGLDDVNKCYAASKTWAFGIEDIGYRLMNRLSE